ncbi:cytochrome P450 [Streptomyces sp. NPDC005805]|uniref:cytochrome P450 n=1 Tax=Streptomyces sp. NPDC005805 TaxID=3157068 RepID=UPI0033DD4A9A
MRIPRQELLHLPRADRTDRLRHADHDAPHSPWPHHPTTPPLLQTLCFLLDPIGFLAKNKKKYGDVFRIKLLGLPEEAIITSSHLAAEAFSHDEESGMAGEVRRQFLEPSLGKNSLLTADGEIWKQHRKVINPTLHGRCVQGYREAIHEIAATEISKWSYGKSFALRESVEGVTLRVIIRVVFGISDEKRSAELAILLPEYIRKSGSPLLIFMPPRIRDSLFRSRIARRVPFLPTTRMDKVRRRVDAILYDEIKGRKARTSTSGTDVLSRLIDPQGKAGRPLSDPEIRDELVALLTAGHETTATALAWAFERLMRTPSVLSRLENALQHEADDRYLEAVVKEALRSRPVVWDAPRRLRHAVSIGDYTVPAGWAITPVIALIHQDSRYFAKPEVFEPERFMGDVPAETRQAWLPFGGGRRYCAGAQLALLEMKVIMREVLMNVTLTAADDSAESARMQHVTLVPRRGARAVARRRSPLHHPAEGGCKGVWCRFG